MTKLQTVLLAIASAIAAAAVYKFAPGFADNALALGLAGLCTTLLGWAKQHPDDAKALEAASTTTTVSETVTKPTEVIPIAGNKGVGYPGKGGALLIFLISAMLATSSCAWWQKHGPQIDCAALATVVDAPQLVAIVEGCMAIAVTPSAIPACVAAAAESKWASDVLGCFERAAQGKASCPAFKAGQIKLKAMRASAGASK
jgi:hypothetical protein